MLLAQQGKMRACGCSCPEFSNVSEGVIEERPPTSEASIIVIPVRACSSWFDQDVNTLSVIVLTVMVVDVVLEPSLLEG